MKFPQVISTCGITKPFDCTPLFPLNVSPVMSDVLHKATVLVLNRNWQAIDVKTPADAFCMMAAGTATALDIAAGANMAPTLWTAWLDLPVRESDNAVWTVHGPVRVPTVLVLARYDKVPKRRPKLSGKGIWERDGG